MIFRIFQRLFGAKPKLEIDQKTRFLQLVSEIHAASEINEDVRQELRDNAKWIDIDLPNHQKLWMSAIYRADLPFLKFLKEECGSSLKSDTVSAWDLVLALSQRIDETPELWNVMEYIFSHQTFGKHLEHPIKNISSMDLQNDQLVVALTNLYKIKDIFMGIKSHHPLRAVVEEGIENVSNVIQRNTLLCAVEHHVEPVKKRRM